MSPTRSQPGSRAEIRLGIRAHPTRTTHRAHAPPDAMRTDLVLDALRMALTRRKAGADVQLIHHSVARSQYTSLAFQQVLDDHGVPSSIGSVGDALDNAMAESFVDTFKTELISDRVWRTRAQLELAIVEWVARFNSTRLHQSRRLQSFSLGRASAAFERFGAMVAPFAAEAGIEEPPRSYPVHTYVSV
jgi:transposase InsO family protein